MQVNPLNPDNRKFFGKLLKKKAGKEYRPGKD